MNADLRFAVEYLHIGQKRLVMDVASATASRADAVTMMRNLRRNGHLYLAFRRVAMDGDNYTIVTCHYCKANHGITSMRINVRTTPGGEQVYACTRCATINDLTTN